MDAESQPGSQSSKRKRKLPAGMSDYQAAWIAEEDLEGIQESESEDEAAEPMSHNGRKGQSGSDGQSLFAPDLEDDDETDDMQVLCRCNTFACKVVWMYTIIKITEVLPKPYIAGFVDAEGHTVYSCLQTYVHRVQVSADSSRLFTMYLYMENRMQHDSNVLVFCGHMLRQLAIWLHSKTIKAASLVAVRVVES